MPIQVTPQPDADELSLTLDNELCIFCNSSTAYWHEETNRPVCPQCSVQFSVDDIPYANLIIELWNYRP